MTRTPAEEGFFMPPEWAAHTCCWMAWPCRENSFYDLDAGRDDFATVARSIARFEPVRMIANPGDVEDARRRCGRHSDGSRADVEIVSMPTDDSWARDSAPTFLVGPHGALGAIEWPFTCWGGFRTDCAETARMARRVIDLTGARRFAAPIALEGGAIHTDGQGTLLTTEEVVLDEDRNPGLTRTDAEEILRQYLGLEKVVWLRAALEDDPTGGHIDTLASFVSPGVVVALSCEDPADPQYEPLCENIARLRAAETASGRPLQVVTIDHPPRRFDREDGHRNSWSYINFYIGNGVVVMPAFGDPHDEAAHETLARLLPGRAVVQLPLMELARLAGSIHCMTQQQAEAQAYVPERTGDSV
jgi:agmatine deiminase